MARTDTIIAFDRASVRSFDKDGHLHVASANISKAAINPYLGSEIPDSEKLGLDPSRTYRLYRHPAELEKAAPSFSGKPILIKHTPIGADDHPHDQVVGAVGDVTYNHPYLQAPLHFWPGNAIDLIKSGEQAQLSAGYRYTPEMKPGVVDGEHFDGVMKNLVGNHLALVREGRAGADVVIGDSAQTLEQTTMQTQPLSRKAALVQGALIGFLPQLAQDKSLPGLVAGLTAKNYADRKPALQAGILKIAKDANGSGLSKLLDALTDANPAEGAEGKDDIIARQPPVDPADLKPNDPANDPQATDPISKARAFLAGKLSPEDMKTFETLIAAIGGNQDPAADPPPPPGVPPKPPAKDADPNDPTMPPRPNDPDPNHPAEDNTMPQPALDAAIALAVKPAVAAAVAAERAANKEAAGAKEAVEAIHGRMGACDSADDYYRAGLAAFGVKTAKDMPAPALKPTFDALAEARVTHRINPVVAAMDAAQAKTYAEKFPDADRLSRRRA